MSAQTLAEAGHSVLILDGGQSDRDSANRIPDKTFSALRSTEENQEEYFLGSKFESLPPDKTTTGACNQ